MSWCGFLTKMTFEPILRDERYKLDEKKRIKSSYDVKDVNSTYLECYQQLSIAAPFLNLVTSVHENCDVILLRAGKVAKMIFHSPFKSNI